MRIVRSVLTLVAFCTLIAACNTFAGMGKDMKAGGQDIENAANR